MESNQEKRCIVKIIKRLENLISMRNNVLVVVLNGSLMLIICVLFANHQIKQNITMPKRTKSDYILTPTIYHIYLTIRGLITGLVVINDPIFSSIPELIIL